jgi:hypothetical protein
MPVQRDYFMEATMLFQIDDQSNEQNQAIIEVFVGRNTQYPDPCPVTWKCITPLAFAIPNYRADELLGTQMVDFSLLGNTGYLWFYFLTNEKKRVNVFRFFEPFTFGGFWNGDGDCEIFRAGSNRMKPGLCAWKQLTWAKPFLGD